MKVKVIPTFPIPGILPKNKKIIEEMILDLNKNEIIHCMQYGNVFDENGHILDKFSLSKISFVEKCMKKYVQKAPKQVVLEPEKIVEDNNINILKEETEPIVEVVESYYGINIVSITKDDYINIESVFDTNTKKLEGNLYGLFDITKGPRPSLIEYKNGDEWITFAKKFTDFSELKDGDKLLFRLLPKNDSAITFALSIKEKNVVIATVSETIEFK